MKLHYIDMFLRKRTEAFIQHAVYRHSGHAQKAEGHLGLYARCQHVCLQNCNTNDKPSDCSAVQDVNPQGPAAGEARRKETRPPSHFRGCSSGG